ncbi:N,N-dimethylformamidase beta subunit family domain-containing protein [Raineyella fluvialis]|uniref:N,N-dimethylformamidase beta subunit-like C-terminal domain-containing protein n=1 Tax=Raineyella fluvialis TaxID=2662261 RepID=A0A5Q2FEY5_9ACTN|nr:N,N-dimethylformamidase beta subunit family domain-containing protein [Raineyella fluvialis]QGF24064.1 hypothetical protein Rai3103_10660 [Raineyella fluvialis]
MGSRSRRRRPLAAAAALIACLLVASACAGPARGPKESPSTASRTATPTQPWTVTENAKPGTGDWEIDSSAVAGDAQLAGYADHTSVLPGESFGLFVTSTLGDVAVAAYRVGAYGGAGARLVWQAPQPIKAVKQPDPVIEADHMVVAKWAKTTDVATTDWPEGSYLLKLTAGGKSRYVPVTVRSRSTAGRLVIVNAVITDQAYNDWGGYSLYDGPGDSRSTRVSFDRPQKGNGAQQFFGDELAPIQLAEGLGVDLAYVTSVDLDREPDLLNGASGMVSMGHDEYWTVPERTAVEKARDSGTSLAFLGANAVYWRVRLEDGQTGDRRVVVGYKNTSDPKKNAVNTTVMWRSQPYPHPENSLTGMLYECFPAYGDMVIQDPTFPLFDGTGVKKGDKIPGVVGIEIDRAYPIPGTPDALTVAAHSPVTCGSNKHTYSDMTYYSTGKAGVWATGSMMWVKVLNGPNGKYNITDASVTFVRRVMENAFRQMAKGNGKGALQTTPNLSGLNASASTSTGTGGPVDK